MEVQQTIIIALPVERVFAYRSALQQTIEWQKEVITSEVQAPGVAQLGARSVESRRGANGEAEEWELEITEFERNRVLGIESHCAAIQIRERGVFVAIAGNTSYTVSVEMTGSPLTAAALQKKIVEALLNLKWLLENPNPSNRTALRALRSKVRPQAVPLGPV